MTGFDVPPGTSVPHGSGSTPAVSVVISTYNRGRDLHDTLRSLLQQSLDASRYEILVVDNNSSDDTKAVVEAIAAQNDGPVRYLFEPQQGVSFGRNAGIRASRAPLIAFTDDDVIAAPAWLANIVRAFDTYADVDYLTGKILPLFASPPADWLTVRNSGPCTIRDRGEDRLFSTPGHFFPGWATANLAVRRSMLDRSGLFAGDFDRGEDLEFIIRVWRAGGRGMYAPDMVVSHKIPAERISKAYHRMWHRREGEIRARVRYKELFDVHGALTAPRRSAPLFGAPAFLYRELADSALQWLKAAARNDQVEAFFHESQTRQNLSYLRTRIGEWAARRSSASNVSNLQTGPR